MANYFRSDGSRITEGQKLGQGGEGSVFEIKELPGEVSKIYHSPPSSTQIAKLLAMIALKTEEILRIASWPIDTLHKTKGGNIIGFIMPKVEGYKPVHELYSPKSRRIEFPQADWRFLINTAANISRAFAIIHSHNHVIGDVNHGNLIVGRDGTVKLIDCDSFQIQQGAQFYPCEVGVPEYTPPELISHDLAKTIRNQNHDAFGLAVLNFHLLFLGRHPFAGKYLGNGYMPIDRAIKENRFVYGPDSLSKLMEPPPNTLPMNSASSSVVRLFDTAFNSSGLFIERPKAKDWVASLVDLTGQLKQCSVSSSHYFLNSLNACPWCTFERKLGIDFFITKPYTTIQSFNVDLVWPRIQALKRPAYFQIPFPTITEPSEKVKYERIKIKNSPLIYLFVGIIALGFSILSNLNSGITSFISIGGLTLLNFILPKKAKIIATYANLVNSEKVRFEELIHEVNMPLREFDIELAELKSLKAEHYGLGAERMKGFEYLKQNIRESQLQKYLEKFEIKSANLKNIGEGRQQMLMSFGIETAADVSLQAVGAVPGFGPAFAKILTDWRRDCEKGFVFDFSKGVDPVDIAKLDKKINDKKAAIESRLANGAQKLQNLINDFHHAKKIKMESVEEAAEDYAQAVFDLNFIK